MSNPAGIRVEPSREQLNLAALYGWEILGWKTYDRRDDPSNALLGRMLDNGQEEYLSVPMRAPLEEWIARLSGRGPPNLPFAGMGLHVPESKLQGILRCE